MRELGDVIQIVLRLPGVSDLRELKEGYVAGGAVRDAFLGEEIHDIDIYTPNVEHAKMLLLSAGGVVEEDRSGNAPSNYAIYKFVYPGSPYGIDLMEMGEGMIGSVLGDFDYRCNAVAIDIVGALFHLPGALDDIRDRKLVQIRGDVPDYRKDLMEHKGFKL